MGFVWYNIIRRRGMPMWYKIRFISGKEYAFESDCVPEEFFRSEWIRFHDKWVHVNTIEEIEQSDYSKKKRSLV